MPQSAQAKRKGCFLPEVCQIPMAISKNRERQLRFTELNAGRNIRTINSESLKFLYKIWSAEFQEHSCVEHVMYNPLS